MQCNCKNGYTRSSYDTSLENCVDIDECSGTNICDENAECTNEPGGYTCRCRHGFTGNGHQCQSNEPSPSDKTNNERENIRDEDQSEEHQEEHFEDGENADDHNTHYGEYRPEVIDDRGGEENENGYDDRYDTVLTASPSPNVPSLAPDHWLCDQCSQHAECNRGICTCRPGYRGDGTVCDSVCAEGDVWAVDRCQPAYTDVDDEG